MNKTRAKHLQKLIDRLAAIRIDLEVLQEQEQDAFDNASEAVQDSERGDEMEQAARDIEAAVNAIDEAISYATDAQGGAA